MSLAIHDDLDRSASPPGRETREDWRPSGGGDGASRNGRSRSPPSSEKRRSRSRSPLRKSGRDSSPTREWRYIRDGTNTTSREPHLERARLFVGNIDANRTHRRDLIKLFSCYGDVMGVSIHKGYAFVQMDRERTANKAINYEDNRVFMGAQIHVEFSQAALKAGAKYERLPERSSPQHSPRSAGPHPPPRERYAAGPPPPPPPSDTYYIEEQERQREARLERILQMEREIAMLRTHEVDVSRKGRGGGPEPPHHDSYDRRDSYRRSPGGPHGGYGDSYDRRDREQSYHRGGERGGNHGNGNGRSGGIYSRLSPPPGHPRGSGGGDGAYREHVSYPAQYGGNYGGRSAPGVGYSSQGGKGNALPPGWPSGSEKVNSNRAPFSNSGPWS